MARSRIAWRKFWTRSSSSDRGARPWKARMGAKSVYAVLVASLLVAFPGRASARPRLCLPPVYEGGQRLHQMPAPSTSWLELALRQHEICWRQSDDQVRVALLGASA